MKYEVLSTVYSPQGCEIVVNIIDDANNVYREIFSFPKLSPHPSPPSTRELEGIVAERSNIITEYVVVAKETPVLSMEQLIEKVTSLEIEKAVLIAEKATLFQENQSLMTFRMIQKEELLVEIAIEASIAKEVI